jgi:hypothetical protein
MRKRSTVGADMFILMQGMSTISTVVPGMIDLFKPEAVARNLPVHNIANPEHFLHQQDAGHCIPLPALLVLTEAHPEYL